MKIEIRHMEKIKEGTAIIAVIPELTEPVNPYNSARYDASKLEEKKEKYEKEMDDYEKEKKEIKLLHLGEAELIQKEEKE